MLFYKCDSYLNIQFPIQLEASFLAVFPAASLNPETDYWDLELKEEPRLKQWMELMCDVAADIELLEKRQSTDEKRQQVESLTAALNQQYSEATLNSREAARSILALEDALDTLDDIERAKGRAATRLAEQRQKLETLLCGIVDVDAIREAAGIMDANRDPEDPVKKAAFEAARAFLKAEQHKLDKAWLQWAALDQLVRMDINEVLCDFPPVITTSDWLTVTPVEGMPGNQSSSHASSRYR